MDVPANDPVDGPADRREVRRPRAAPRPRDELGRPLPRGAVGVERMPEGIARTPDETLTEAQRLLDAGLPFHAHEVLEDAWKATTGAERELWRGLAQLAVGVTHAARGNPRGAATLLDRAAGTLAPFAADPPHGVDVPGLLTWARGADPGGALTAPPLRSPRHASRRSSQQ